MPAVVIGRLSLVIGGVLASVAGRASADALADRAQVEFLKGKKSDDPVQRTKAFAAAASYYKDLRGRGAQSPALYLNLGRAQYLAGEIAEAIASFRRGLRLRPDNAELRESLEYARSRVDYPSGTRAPAPSWPAWLSPNAWLGMMLVLHALGWLAWCRRHATGTGTLWVWALFAAAGICAVAWGASEWRLHQETSRTFVVVAVDGVPLHRGNGESYPAHAEVPALGHGVEAELLHRRGDWLQVRLGSGQIGWVQKRQVLLE